MSDDLNESGDGTETVAQKIDTLAASVDQRFDAFAASVDERFASQSASVDARFDAVDVALVEQRQYTEFAFDRVDKRFDRVDKRFDRVDDRFDGIDRRFDRLERKLDQFIDTQSATNKLVERRLAALEPRSAHE